MGTALAYSGLAGLPRTFGTGYQGPPALTVARAFTQWTLDPWMLALVLILGGGYLAGAHRQPGWPVARRIWFLGLGLGFLVIATMSWVGVYQPVLFYARAVQTVLLVLVVPLFLTLGRPISLAIAVFPRAGARLEAAIRSRPAGSSRSPRSPRSRWWACPSSCTSRPGTRRCSTAPPSGS